MYFARSIVIQTLHKCKRQLTTPTTTTPTTTTPTTPTTTSTSTSGASSLSFNSLSLSMPTHVSNNLAATFQFVDERLLGMVPRSSLSSLSPSSSSSSSSSWTPPTPTNHHHPSTLPDLMDDALCQQRVSSVTETSTLVCSGSDLLVAILPLLAHMRRCGVLKYDHSQHNPHHKPHKRGSSASSSSGYAKRGSLLSSPSVDATQSNQPTHSQCLSWRLLPVLRTVLAIHESTGQTTEQVTRTILGW